ncbi:hypothetical protein LCGC14_3097000 [marine sediment metagenome]|uniref:Uncharacterized protein n=1 Tax=marine sediment metagenome TaxID=412755 RepID=A0A0F8YZ38_9ZZZZ
MKVRRDGGWGWKPFDLVLTVESEEEAKAFYAIFNYAPNMDILPEGVGEIVREAIGRKYSDLGASQLIARGVYYREFYRGKKED